MMIIVPERMTLPVGQIYYPHRELQANVPSHIRTSVNGKSYRVRSHRIGRQHLLQIVLQHPQHGEYRGPFYVVREVTADQYLAWYAQETGESIGLSDLPKNPPRRRFYEVSID